MFKKKESVKEADICLFLEGSYPYVTGGVSTWVHKLISSLNEFTFHLVCILPVDFKLKYHYDMPSNVVDIDNLFLQQMPKGQKIVKKKKRESFFSKIETPILNLQYSANLSDFKKIIEAVNDTEVQLGSNILLNSEDAWKMLLRMYRETVGGGSFLNYFWSWRNLLSSFYSIILADLPQAKVYHSLCTGYAGLFLSRAYLEKGRPCLLTEHGIYANERRIEIIAAEWLKEQKSQNLNIFRPSWERDIKDYWIDTFLGYSKIAYAACDQIITLYEGNKQSEIDDGADLEKIRIIPNGVDEAIFSKIKRNKNNPPTIALIGRVVPIKDIKTFINVSTSLVENISDLRAWIIGPTDEDEPYYLECLELVIKNGLQDTVKFLGKVTVLDYLSEIDVLVLTSISEAQPLVVLEAGAAGIPCVATDVGSCSELIFGRSDEDPKLGPGGDICSMSASNEIAESIYRLLTQKEFYEKCSIAIKERIKKYYDIADVDRKYREIYKTLTEK